MPRYPRVSVAETVELSFTAGEALSGKEVVYLSAANTVSKADNSVPTKVLGVAKSSATSGASVAVVTYGRVASVVADGAVSVGDMVTPGSTAGRLATAATSSSAGSAHGHGFSSDSGNKSGGTPSGNTDSGSTHTHSITAITAGTPAGGVQDESSHTHSGSGNVGAEAAHTHSGTGNVGSENAHTHGGGGATGTPSATTDQTCISTYTSPMYASLTVNGACDDSFLGIQTGVIVSIPTSTHTHTSPTTDVGSSHTHTMGNVGAGTSHTHAMGNVGAGTAHYHTFTGVAMGTHNHGGGATGSEATHFHTFTGSALADHNHTIPNSDNESTHSHTTSIGYIVGKALTAASGAGETFDIFVCLAG